MAKTVGATTTQETWNSSGALPLLISDGATDYVYGPGGLVLEQVSAGTTLFYYQDQLGSTRALATVTGTVVASYTYDPYGNLTGSSVTGTVSNPFGFAGQYTDAESGLIYLRARYYDPATGQFLTRDPLAAISGSAYGYAGGSPLNAADPTGLFCLFSNLAGFFSRYGGEIGEGALVVGLLALTFTPAGPLAVEVVGAIWASAGTTVLTAAAGLGAAGAVAGALGFAAEDGVSASGEEELATTPAGRVYSSHYLNETGPLRNIPGSVVDSTIDEATDVTHLSDRTNYYDAKNDVTVVQSDTTGKIMSVRRGAQ